MQDRVYLLYSLGGRQRSRGRWRGTTPGEPLRLRATDVDRLAPSLLDDGVNSLYLREPFLALFLLLGKLPLQTDFLGCRHPIHYSAI
jgi:hypothetical protein